MEFGVPNKNPPNYSIIVSSLKQDEIFCGRTEGEHGEVDLSVMKMFIYDILHNLKGQDSYLLSSKEEASPRNKNHFLIVLFWQCTQNDNFATYNNHSHSCWQTSLKYSNKPEFILTSTTNSFLLISGAETFFGYGALGVFLLCPNTTTAFVLTTTLVFGARGTG